MVEKKINQDGTITWTYTFNELMETIQNNAENPYRLDQDLEMKDKIDEWNDR